MDIYESITDSLYWTEDLSYRNGTYSLKISGKTITVTVVLVSAILWALTSREKVGCFVSIGSKVA